VSKRAAKISAETYVEEPGDLWSAALPPRRHGDLPQLVRQGRSYVWAWPDGRLLTNGGPATRTSLEGTSPRQLSTFLDRAGLRGAVLYPSAVGRLYAGLGGEGWPDGLLEECLDAYNYWVLGLAATDPDRLRAVALVDVADPSRAVEAMRYWASAGAAGFVLPCAPGGEQRYDDPDYEVLWRTADELGRPLVFLAGANPAAPLDPQSEEPRPQRTLATRLAYRATSVFPARRSVTAVTYAGVFERYPRLRIGTVGFGASWRAFAMVRADEMYDVRPERTGPPTRVPPEYASAVKGWTREATAIDSSQRSGTRGMAPEGVGFHFAEGEFFSDHFRRNVFSTFTAQDDLAIHMRPFLGTEGLLWGTGGPPRGRAQDVRPRGQAAASTGNGLFRGVSDSELAAISGGNTSAIFGFSGRET
jgi:predicted TIM-barrel fold metal-dependent hydrolase